MPDAERSAQGLFAHDFRCGTTALSLMFRTLTEGAPATLRFKKHDWKIAGCRHLIQYRFSC
jgi:hypothetical protein